MSWTQVYDPLGWWPLSTLVSALPVLTLFFVLLVLRKRVWVSALAGMLMAIGLAAAVFGMPAPLITAAALNGVVFGFFRIAWIIIASIYLYNVAVETGQFQVMKESIAGLSSDRRLQVILIAFCFGAFLDCWEKMSISSVATDENRWMEGRSIYNIASVMGKEPVDILFDILIKERLMVNAIFASMHEGNLKKFLSLPYCMVGTDSAARSFSGLTYKGKPHPRGFGSFPRFIRKYVRDENLMSMSEGIHKITMLPAQTFGIHERGIIKSGAYADIIIFDREKIIDTATYKNPLLKPEGIYYVFVNGYLLSGKEI